MSEKSVAEILQQVRAIQIVARRSVDDLFAGQYQSVFRGRGMEFDEVREYQPGDDVRTIDWNVTARSGGCFIKRYCEERELTVLFVVDISASGAFGSTSHSKLDVLVETVALLMFSALKSNDRTGLLTFCDEVCDYYPPRKGKSHVLHLIRELVAVEPIERPTRVTAALDYLNRVQKRRAVVFLLSDLMDSEAERNALRRALQLTNRRHDLSVMTISDRREREFPDVGLVQLQDAETGEMIEIDTSSRHVRHLYASWNAARERDRATLLRQSAVDHLELDTGTDNVAELRRFFRQRAQRAPRH